MNVHDRYGMTKPFSLFLNSITAIVKVFFSRDFRKEFIKNEIMIIVPGGIQNISKLLMFAGCTVQEGSGRKTPHMDI